MQTPSAQTFIRSSQQQLQGQSPVEPGFVILSGMVWSANDGDINEFLHDCSIQKINFVSTDEGKPSGNAVVKLSSKDDVAKAVRHDRHFIRERWVKVEEIDEKSAEIIINTQPANESCSFGIGLSRPNSMPQNFGSPRPR